MNSSVEVELTGISPLLMHSYPLVKIENPEKLPAEEQAEFAAYRAPESRELYVPGPAVQRALVAAAGYSKGKGRSTLQKVTAASVLVTPDRLGLGTTEYRIDSRRVVISATRGACVRHRPRIDTWKIRFNIEWDPMLLTEQQLRKITDDACSLVGFLDFRPACKGPFGRAMVTAWTVNGRPNTK